MTNRYRGVCATCERIVEVGDGTFRYGNVYCGDAEACEARKAAADALAMRRSSEQQRVMNDREFVPTLPELVEWRENFWRMKDERDAAEAADPRVKARRERMVAEDAAWTAQGLKRCVRCGGAGRNDAWWATGYTCFECEGRGAVAA
jgi:hypothetical protein